MIFRLPEPRTFLRACGLCGCCLSGCGLSGCRLCGCRLCGCRLCGCRLRDSARCGGIAPRRRTAGAQ
ncbi:pentapeptide repeat-containing protein, partial [Gemmatimonas sp.]